jgi:hypothetical protein
VAVSLIRRRVACTSRAGLTVGFFLFLLLLLLLLGQFALPLLERIVGFGHRAVLPVS